TAAVQQLFLPPRDLLTKDKLQVATIYRPAERCSGDWWSYDEEGPDRVIALLGDVTGHGAAPAMITASVATSFRVTKRLGKTRDTAELLREVSHDLYETAGGTYTMTLSLLEADLAAGVVRCVTAG